MTGCGAGGGLLVEVSVDGWAGDAELGGDLVDRELVFAGLIDLVVHLSCDIDLPCPEFGFPAADPAAAAGEYDHIPVTAQAVVAGVGGAGGGAIIGAAAGWPGWVDAAAAAGLGCAGVAGLVHLASVPDPEPGSVLPGHRR